MHFFVSKKNTREKIIEATYELLATKGYAQISMRDIAKKAQTAVGQLTYYYGTKEHLIGSVIEEMVSMFVAELRRCVEKSNDKLHAVTNFFEELYEKEKDVFKVLIDFTAQSLWNESFRDKIDKFYEETIAVISDVYAECGCDEELAKSKAGFFMVSVSGTAIQKVLCKRKDSVDEMLNFEKKIVDKERKLFNVRKAGGLL